MSFSNQDDFLTYVDDYSGKKDISKFIDDRIKLANDAIEDAYILLNTSIEGFGAVIQGTTIDDVPDWDVSDPDFDPNVLRGETPPVSPELAGKLPLEIEIDRGEEREWESSVDIPNEPNIDRVDISALRNLTVPTDTTGEAPPTDLHYSPVDYVDGLSDFIDSLVQQALNATTALVGIDTNPHVDLEGNTGDVMLVDNRIEDAVYDRAFSRARDEASQKIADVSLTFQSRGFSLPPGALTAAISAVQIATGKTNEDLNNDVIVSRINLEQKRTEYDLQKASQVTDAQFKYDTIVIQLEGVETERLKTIADAQSSLMDAATKIIDVRSRIYNSNEERKFNVEKDSVANALKAWETSVEFYKSLMEAYRIEAEATASAIQTEADYNTSTVAIFSEMMKAAQIEAEIEQINLSGTKMYADIDATRINTDLGIAQAENARLLAISQEYATAVQDYSSRIDALKTSETLDLTRYEAESRGKASEITALSQRAVAQAELAVKEMGLQIEALKSQATISSNIISASLNAVSTQASLGFSGRSGVTTTGHTSHDKSITYTYHGEAPDTAPY